MTIFPVIGADKAMETAKPVMLIVRPSGRAKDDVEVCRRAGWQAEVLSPIEIETDEASLKRLPEMYARADAVFWVSPAAVETAVPYLNLSDGIKAHIAVGQGSRRALARYAGAGVFAPEDGNDSEAVLRLPVWNSLPEGARVLSVRGHGGRDFLMNALQEKGFRTEVAEVYFRRHKPLNFQNFQTENIAAAYITSTELVQSLFAQLPPQFSRFFKSLLYFTHHPRIAEALKREGVCSVETVPTLEAALSYSSISVSDGMVFPNLKPIRSKTVGEPENKSSEPVREIQASKEMPSETSSPRKENETEVHIPAAPLSSNSPAATLWRPAPWYWRHWVWVQVVFVCPRTECLENQELAFNQKIDKAALGESENAALLKDNLNRQSAIQSELDRLDSGVKANGEQILMTQKPIAS